MFKQVCEAVNTISDVAQGKTTGLPQNPYDGPGELAAALDDFDVSTIYNVAQYLVQYGVNGLTQVGKMFKQVQSLFFNVA